MQQGENEPCHTLVAGVLASKTKAEFGTASLDQREDFVFLNPAEAKEKPDFPPSPESKLTFWIFLL